MGWSCDWVRRSRTRRVRPESSAASATVSSSMDSLKWWEQEQVTRMPPESSQRTAGGIPADGGIVFLLIEKNPSLLAVQKIRLPLKSIHGDLDSIRQGPADNARLEWKGFVLANRYVVPGDDTCRFQEVIQNRD